MTKANSTKIILSGEKLNGLIKHVNKLNDLNNNLYELQDLYLSDVRNLQEALSYITDILNLCRQKDSLGNPCNYMDLVLSNDPKAWKPKRGKK